MRSAGQQTWGLVGARARQTIKQLWKGFRAPSSLLNGAPAEARCFPAQAHAGPRLYTQVRCVARRERARRGRRRRAARKSACLKVQTPPCRRAGSRLRTCAGSEEQESQSQVRTWRWATALAECTCAATRGVRLSQWEPPSVPAAPRPGEPRGPARGWRASRVSPGVAGRGTPPRARRGASRATARKGLCGGLGATLWRPRASKARTSWSHATQRRAASALQCSLAGARLQLLHRAGAAEERSIKIGERRQPLATGQVACVWTRNTEGVGRRRRLVRRVNVCCDDVAAAAACETPY